MSTQIQYVQQNGKGLDEVRIGEKPGIEAPFFVPEIKGPEGLQALLFGRMALEHDNPIVVPGYRWKDIRSKPRFKEVREEIRSLVSDHPMLYYEPVELFRYTRPRNLVTYAFQGSRSSSREFYKKLRKGDHQDAIDKLPIFFQPFLEAQMKPLLQQVEGASTPPKYQQQNSGKVYAGWRDQRADSGFTSYFGQIVDDAEKSANAAVIPPVPPVLASSGTDVISRTLGFNRYMWNLCFQSRQNLTASSVNSYLHFYVDQGVFDKSRKNADRVVQAIQSEVRQHDYAGVAITISNYENVWKKSNSKALERFVNDVTNTARQNHLPVILPRSGWYGAHFTDYGVQAFSALMNGNPLYSRRGGGIDEESRYGTVAVYGAAQDRNAGQLDDYLKRHGGTLPQINGLPDAPPTWNSSASGAKAKYGSDVGFRVRFGKPRRLTHVQEAREFREALTRGNPNPARRYLERSDHPHLA